MRSFLSRMRWQLSVIHVTVRNGLRVIDLRPNLSPVSPNQSGSQLDVEMRDITLDVEI